MAADEINDPRVALVTGGNRGIGLETARLLGRDGQRVVIGARSPTAGETACVELQRDGVEAQWVELDVTSEATIRSAAAWVDERFGKLDALVNNAGVLHELEFPRPSDVSIEVLRATYEVNVFGVVATTNAMLPLLGRSDAPRIVNVSSRLASLSQMHDPEESRLLLLAYNSSKAALNAVTAIYARELRDTAFKVNAVAPGHCATRINGFSGDRSPSEVARLPADMATLPEDGPTGTFAGEGGPIPW